MAAAARNTGRRNSGGGRGSKGLEKEVEDPGSILHKVAAVCVVVIKVPYVLLCVVVCVLVCVFVCVCVCVCVCVWSSRHETELRHRRCILSRGHV